MTLLVSHLNQLIDWRAQSKNTDLKPRITLRDDKGNVIKKADDNEARYYLVPDSILICWRWTKNICRWYNRKTYPRKQLKQKILLEDYLV